MDEKRVREIAREEALVVLKEVLETSFQSGNEPSELCEGPCEGQQGSPACKTETVVCCK